MAKNKRKIWKLKNYDWGRLGLELFVVFLGVSSGFILNNWRMQERENLHEQKYLMSFSNDLNLNITALENAIESDSLWMDRANPLLLSIQNKNISIDSAEVTMILILAVNKMEIHTGTYEDMTNSGNLNIIDDFNLKSQIVDYHIEIKGVGFLNDFFDTYFSDFVMPFIFSEFNVLNLEFDDPEVINTIRFTNVVAGYYSMVQQRIAAYKGLLIISNELRNELNKYK